jgi:uncharacterized membrane protein YoaT (DUF817 family)
MDHRSIKYWVIFGVIAVCSGLFALWIGNREMPRDLYNIIMGSPIYQGFILICIFSLIPAGYLLARRINGIHK